MRASALLILALACWGSPARDAAWEEHAASLAGRWSVRFDYRPDRLAGDRGADRSASGSIEMTINRTMSRAYPKVGVPTNYGTYAVAFTGLGGSPSGDGVPALVAGVAADSVFVFFETDRDGFSMQMRARLAADSIRGSWFAAQSRGTIASGTFIMARENAPAGARSVAP